jgi:hypothetical protein
MTAKLQVLPDPQINPWPVLWESFERSLRADGTSVQTLRMYREAGGQAHAYFAERGLPTDPVAIQKMHVESWLIYLREERLHRTHHHSDCAIVSLGRPGYLSSRRASLIVGPTTVMEWFAFTVPPGPPSQTESVGQTR